MIKLLPTKDDHKNARQICFDARNWFYKNCIKNGRAYLKQGDGLFYGGILAQIMVARHFKAKNNDCCNWDKGVDITLTDGRTADVKTTLYKGGNLLEFPNDVLKKRNDIYIFCTQTGKELSIRGWISRNDFINTAKCFDFGHGLRMYMPISELNQIFRGF